MSLYTSIGTGLWTWEPFRRLPRSHDDDIGRHAQLFWIALYTMPEAKFCVPGMVMGSITALAEGCGFQPDLARSCLDRLLEADMVEYDIERRVLRMTQLPDSGEFPTNDKAILSWWRRFQNVPKCPLRDAHVLTLQWILDEHVRQTGRPLTDKMQGAWAQTFGTIPVPAPRRRGTRRLQQELLPLFPEPSEDASESRRSTVVEQTVRPAAVDNSANCETGNQGVSLTRVKQDPDPEPEPVSDLLSGGGVGEGHDPGTASSSRPHLALVPEGTPYTVEQMLKTLERDSRMAFVNRPDDSLWPALRDVVAHLCAHGVGLDDLALLSAWLGRGLRVEGADGQRYLGPWWAAKPNCVLFAVQRARLAHEDEQRVKAEGERRAAEMRDAMSQGPYMLPMQ